ncbi:hypothetical protein FE257_005089 [Aspergillus nanangensis]|uniref:Uncharacterized protein n=1 Tax=Aspergillus nanangensis TaxID=2582783 RepID=A0AAD4CSV0_ASPNN|nr:hypothetical protein FE257_005089 [Aspergillus nanangensis]
MNPTPLHSPVKDGRRILGEKTANACLSPRHATSPSKRSLVDALSSSPKKLLPSPLFAGQKRSIDQVHRDTLVNKAIDAQHVPVVGSEEEACTPVKIQDVKVQPSQDQQQQDPDAMDSEASPQNEQHPSPSQTSIPESNAKLAENALKSVPEDPETRKLFIQEKASLLRNRLQNAMRNVRDPQFDRRLSELEEHSRKYPRLSFPDSTPTTQPKHHHHLRPEETTSPSSSSSRVLQPAPELNPSSSTGLSSPPLSARTAVDLQDPMKTPTQQSHRRADESAGSPMQLSSPRGTRSPASCETVRKTDDRSPPGQTEVQVVTPSQRGDAVDGLLKLMNTGGST